MVDVLARSKPSIPAKDQKLKKKSGSNDGFRYFTLLPYAFKVMVIFLMETANEVPRDQLNAPAVGQGMNHTRKVFRTNSCASIRRRLCD